MLVKVIVHPKLRRNIVAEKRRHQAFHREDVYTVFQCELVEYIAAEVQANANATHLPLARIAGLCHTSLGLGLLVEKIVDDAGNMALNLKQFVAQHGFTPRIKHELDEFFQLLAQNHVVFNDVSATNIAYGYNAMGRHGMYLVDGYGPKQIIPVYALSKALNRRRLLRKYPNMIGELERAAARHDAPHIAIVQ